MPIRTCGKIVLFVLTPSTLSSMRKELRTEQSPELTIACILRNMHMHKNNQLTIGSTKYVFLSVDEYAQLHPRLVKKLPIQPTHFNFYIVKNCYSIGINAQLLMPFKDGEQNIIFNESFAFPQSDEERAIVIASNFQEQPSVQLSEAVPLYHLYANNFWHWCIECIPKLIALENIGYRGPYIVFKSKFIIETLNLFGIDRKRILFSDKNYIIKNMIVSPNYNYFYTFTHTDILETLRTAILDRITCLTGTKKIYIKRISGRVVNNADEVENFLKKYDFEIMIPENYSVQEQFSNMTNVDFSIMAHGANGLLTLLQKKYSNFIEFFSSAYVVYHTTGIIKLLSLDYLPLVEFRDTPPRIQGHHNGQFCNIDVPLKQLEIFLNNALCRKNHTCR